MIPKGLFTEIIMIALAVGIVFTYIKPTFAEITKTQDDIMLYRTEIEKISGVNEDLQVLVDKLRGVSELDKRKLLTYLPDQVDSIDVMRTLSFMADRSGVVLNQVSFDGPLPNNQYEVNEVNPVPYTFSMQVEGTYSQIKSLLSQLEQNEYPLEVQSLTISVLNGGFLSASVQITTYSHFEMLEDEVFINSKKP